MPKLHTIYANSTTKLSPTQEMEMESINKVQKEGISYASAKCQKLSGKGRLVSQILCGTATNDSLADGGTIQVGQEDSGGLHTAES